ncbi:uncharacterized protein [Procambarus clarkii]|uniref:uncharacterized protein n=1 Tax=Procambarus clarkii TaxID=6728 RepID=UPI001E677820|nr:uncharacterized protein LOC123768193 [Procambarus clarkii]XP_045614562.1 uncharacterized protein LOC123768193 [Procambarus clarkii]XP_045614563.1 uncharacterized protein LOC123768193 [Procambarus clarkii]
MPHITILPQDTDITQAFTLEQCYGCEAGCKKGSFMYHHCPICPSSRFEPTTKMQVLQHLQAHFYGNRIGNVHVKGYMITGCPLECIKRRSLKRKNHFHCPFCEKKFLTKNSFRKHVEKCEPKDNEEKLSNTSVKCPDCHKFYTKKYMARHRNAIHHPPEASITLQKYRHAVSIDENGIYAVSKTLRGTQHPIHVKRVVGSSHPGYCEVRDCVDSFQAHQRSGDHLYQCDHLKAIDFSIAGSVCEMSLDKLLDMLSEGLISSANHKICKEKYDEAIESNSPFIVGITQMKHVKNRHQFWSVYTGEERRWCKFQRIIVTLDSIKSAIWCRCKQRSCWHRSVVAWWLYQESGKSYLQQITEGDSEGENNYNSEVLEHTVREKLPEESIERRIQYIMSMKSIPCGNIFPPFSVDKCPTQLIPSETTCHFCHSALGSPQLVSRRPIVVDYCKPPCRQFETFCKVCPTCHMKYRYNEIKDGLFNFNNILLITYSFLVFIRASLLNHTAISRAVSIIEYTLDLTLNHKELEHAYLAFEALCEYDYKFSCFRCGYHPKVLTRDPAQNEAFNDSENGIPLPNSPVPENDANIFWEKVKKELVAYCFLKNGMKNPYRVLPKNHKWAPYIGNNGFIRCDSAKFCSEEHHDNQPKCNQDTGKKCLRLKTSTCTIYRSSTKAKAKGKF